MRFALEHRFDAPLAIVEDAMVDPAFLESLRLPDVAPPEVLERTVDGATVVVRTRYVYTGSLDSLARRVLRAGDVEWVQEVTLDRSTHRSSFRVVPKVHGDRFSCAGIYELEPDAEATRRTIAGDLRIHVPVFGGRAERMIGSGVVSRMKREAVQLQAWLARPAGP